MNVRQASTLLIALALTAACDGDDAPRSDAGSPTSSPADTVRILAYNIHHGEGMDSVIDLERIAKLVREVDPDLVTLQEVDSAVVRTNGVDQAAELGRLTGMQPVYGRFMAYQGGAYGMALLSRWPVERVENVRLPDGEEPRSALTAVISLPRTGRNMRLVGIHLYRTAEERMAQARALDDHLSPDTIPTVLAGDFNSTPDSDVMEYFARSWAIVDKGEDRLTFSSFDPVREIDHVLLRPSDRFDVLDHRLLDEPVISDHRPLVIDLVVQAR